MRFDLSRGFILLQVCNEVDTVFAKFTEKHDFTTSLQQEE
jgi:hypothetical protein